MAVAGGAIWLSLHNAAQLRCYHATTREQLAEINITAQHMAVAGGAIWLSLHNAAQLRCYHATTREQLAEINITAQVTKMLHGE
ncbi:putative guanine nucleotide exchange factor [Operophtera brumata]|uniref:Putative guanine nucleotide exchange factor n=1 Tax=Operophtera brumata TaxID=104452 RepID=A0A0L7L7C6_OPEBR|nr:putative guanine nucleotide exchange factor [Operophtera brumata]